MIGFSDVVAGKGDSGQSPSSRRRDIDYILDEDYWTNKNGQVEFDHADFESWEVIVTDRRLDRGQGVAEAPTDRVSLPVPSETPNGVDVYVGEHSTSSISPERAVKNVGLRNPISESSIARSGGGGKQVRPAMTMNMPDTYVTLAGGSIPDWVPGIGGTNWGLQAGVKFNASAVEVQVDISFKVGVTSVVLWGWEFGYGERGLCTEVSPSNFPIELEGCIDVQLDGQALSFGGSVSVCAPPSDPCPWIDCQYCLSGLGVSVSVPTP